MWCCYLLKNDDAEPEVDNDDDKCGVECDENGSENVIETMNVIDLEDEEKWNENDYDYYYYYYMSKIELNDRNEEEWNLILLVDVFRNEDDRVRRF